MKLRISWQLLDDLSSVSTFTDMRYTERLKISFLISQKHTHIRLQFISPWCSQWSGKQRRRNTICRTAPLPITPSLPPSLSPWVCLLRRSLLSLPHSSVPAFSRRARSLLQLHAERKTYQVSTRAAVTRPDRITGDQSSVRASSGPVRWVDWEKSPLLTFHIVFFV